MRFQAHPFLGLNASIGGTARVEAGELARDSDIYGVGHEASTLTPIIEQKVVPDSIVYSDSWKGYNVLDVSGFKHFPINHSKLFADAQNHINGIENFLSQAKRHLRKFNGVPKGQFGLYLKECEWRFNNSDPAAQLAQLKQWVKSYLR